jgi:hypothetical protein
VNGKWRVCRTRRKDGSLYEHMVTWDAYNPAGSWTGHFESWNEAMDWATSIVPHIEWWLECQTRQR